MSNVVLDDSDIVCSIVLDDYDGLIKKQANICWYLMKGCHALWSFNDLYNEGVMVFIKCKERFNGTNAFSTLLHTALVNKYRSIRGKWTRKQIPTLGDDIWDIQCREHMSLVREDLEEVGNLSTDAKLLLDMIFNPTDGFVHFITYVYMNDNKRKKSVIKPFMKFYKWSDDRYKRVREEICQKVELTAV